MRARRLPPRRRRRAWGRTVGTGPWRAAATCCLGPLPAPPPCDDPRNPTRGVRLLPAQRASAIATTLTSSTLQSGSAHASSMHQRAQRIHRSHKPLATCAAPCPAAPWPHLGRAPERPRAHPVAVGFLRKVTREARLQPSSIKHHSTASRAGALPACQLAAARASACTADAAAELGCAATRITNQAHQFGAGGAHAPASLFAHLWPAPKGDPMQRPRDGLHRRWHTQGLSTHWPSRRVLGITGTARGHQATMSSALCLRPLPAAWLRTCTAYQHQAAVSTLGGQQAPSPPGSAAALRGVTWQS